MPPFTPVAALAARCRTAADCADDLRSQRLRDPQAVEYERTAVLVYLTLPCIMLRWPLGFESISAVGRVKSWTSTRT